jgi:hypothetical protein
LKKQKGGLSKQRKHFVQRPIRKKVVEIESK